MVGMVSSNFSDLVVIGERIEVGMRKGKIMPKAATSHTNKEIEEETNLTTSTPNPQLPSL
ncbi:hypothetical protein CR513_52136, partial [Mucuna pruriens]